MNQPRPTLHDPGLYQLGRNPPPAKPPVPGNMPMYNPNLYNPGYPPSNGSWGPPRQQPPHHQQQPPQQQQQQQQQQHAPPTGQESWDWDENVNNYKKYPEPRQTPNVDPKPQNVLPSNPPSMYSVPDFSLTQQGYPTEHVNNNQYEGQAPTGNQNWGWNDGEDWGWSGDYQQQSSHQQLSQPPLPTGHEIQPVNYQGVMPPPPSAGGLETGFSSLSLTGQGHEEAQERPAWAQQQSEPPQTEESNSSSWSRVPTWGSALDEHASLEPGSDQGGYPRELGERNTFADGASFTDPSQPLPPPSLGNGQIYPPTVIQTVPLDQQPAQNPYGVGRPINLPPPASLNLGEMARLSPSPQVGANIIDQTEPSCEIGATEQGALPAHRMNSGTPANHGATEGFNSGTGPVATTYGSEFHGGMPASLPDVPIGNRLPGSGSRSQSGTPSMERESERPDAEGGYENDQPTPLFSQPPTAPYGAMAERKQAQESPAGSRPSSRQAGSIPSSESTPTANPSPYHLAGEGSNFVRPKPVAGASSFYPVVTSSHPVAAAQPAIPNVARGPQEAVGSEFGPPLSAVPLSRADGMTTPSSILPPSSQRMIPGSGSQGPPLLTMAPIPQQVQPQTQTRPAGTVTPVSEQRIVTGFAKNDPVPVAPIGPSAQGPILATTPQGPPSLQQVEEVRVQSLSRSPPPPHRSETIGSENPRANINSGAAPTGGTVGGNGSADRSDDRISSDRDRDREIKPQERGSRVERERDRDDYDRDVRNRYPEDDEDERFSTSYRERERDRRYDGDRGDRGDRDREHRDPRRYADERDRGYSRQDYDDDRRSGYGPSDRDRARDPRRRDTRRSDYYLTEADVYERSGGRRSSLYEGDNNDPASEFNRSAYGFNTSRDARRRDPDRSRMDDRYYPRDRPVADVAERAQSERDYRHQASSSASSLHGRRRDARDVYYQDPRYYSYSRDAAYSDPYRSAGYPAAAAAAAYNQYYNQQMNYALKYNYAYFEELRLKNPAAYSEWYQRNYAQRYTPTVVTGGTGTALGSIAASEADRASVHSGRSSVNEDHPSMLANHSISQQLRGSTTGLDQSHAYDYGLYQDENQIHGINTAKIRPTQDMTPHKFSCPHVIARFSPGGILVRVLPNSPKDGVAAHIELHDLNLLLGDLPMAQEMKFFPGPLVAGQTHKQQVAVFCQQKIRRAMDDSNQLVDRQSYLLLWELLLLLLRQNGTIVGTDIAELLLKDHEILREPVVQEVADHSETGSGTIAADRTLVSRQTEASVTKKFRELLLFGNKKQALEWAMTQGLWGHALFLASKMDQRTYSSVMIRFANGLALTDPLQTLYQLMSGRQPTAVTSCGDDKWGDWRPHLAMILSNSTSKSASSSSDLDKKSIVTLGDTLSARGFLQAAHFCYLVAQVEFGSYSNKASKLVLLSSSSSLSFDAFATNEAIQCTEVYEYARQLAAPEFMIPSFQSYKFLYATRLAEHGRAAEALQYCEAVGNVLARSASAYPPSLIDQVYQLGSMLKYSDPQFLTENDGTPMADPAWLTGLEAAAKAAQTESPVISENSVLNEQQVEPESLPVVDYSSYQQQQQQQGQYGSEQHNSQPQQQQQPQYYQQTSTPSYYDPQQAVQQQQQQQPYANEDSSAHQQPTNEQENNPYSSSAVQDYGSYGSSQYNPSYSWQQPQQQQQQQQQPWNYSEASGANGGWNPSNNNLKDSNWINASPSLGPEEETKESDGCDGQEDGGPMTVEPIEPIEAADLTTGKRVVFGGTYPIDRPMSLNFTGPATKSARIRQMQQMSLTLKTPRTFAIDEPIRQDNSAESATSADEDAGPGSFSDMSYFNPPSSSTGPSAEANTDNKSTSKPENGGGGNTNSSKAAAAAAARAQQAGSGGSWLGGFFSKFKPKTQMKLPDDKNPTIVWDPKKGQWVDTAKDSEDEAATLAPPPKDASFQSLPSVPLTPAFSTPAPLSLTAANNNNNEANRFGLNKSRVGRGGGRNYVNPSNIQISSANSPIPLLDPFPNATPLPAVPQFFVPSPSVMDSSAPSDFVSSPSVEPQGPDSGERFMYNPTQLAPPTSGVSRPSLASRGRYPR